MRRQPVYFLVDVSKTMAGEPIIKVKETIKQIIHNLRNDPYCLETVYLSLITFSDEVEFISLWNEISKVLPSLKIDTATKVRQLGKVLEYLEKEIESSVAKTTIEQKGDRKPIVVLFTNNTKIDENISSIEFWRSQSRNRCCFITVIIDEETALNKLGMLSDDIATLSDLDNISFDHLIEAVSRGYTKPFRELKSIDNY